MKKYFVTGGAGFIGSHLVDELMKTGSVTVFDNLLSGREQFIEHHYGKENFKFIKADLRDPEAIINAVKCHDTVFHLAANPDAMLGTQNTRLDLELETLATYNLLEAMKINGVKEIVFASSGTVFGDTPVIPLNETYGPLLPISMYGAAKLACEGLISAYSHCFGMKGWIYRFANVCGGRTTHGVIKDFISKLNGNPKELLILGDGRQEKPYVHVKECVEGIVFGYNHARDEVNLFCLGCDTSVDVNTVARTVVSQMGLEGVEFKYSGGTRGWTGDVPQVRFNVAKINQLGWKAKLTAKQAIEQAVQDVLAEK